MRPDLLTTAKALGSGFPCAALLMTDTLAADLGAGAMGTTFGGGPLALIEVWSLIFIVPALVFALIKQGIYSYRFMEEELVVRDGLLTKKERHIPYDRVHNVALVQNPFHRLLGVHDQVHQHLL